MMRGGKREDIGSVYLLRLMEDGEGDYMERLEMERMVEGNFGIRYTGRQDCERKIVDYNWRSRKSLSEGKLQLYTVIQ